MRRPFWLCLLVAGCAVDPPRDNPSDPKSPIVAPGSLIGTVTLDATSRALGDVQLTEVTISVDGSGNVTADTTGAFRVEGVRDGLHTVEFLAPYHDPLRIEAVRISANKTLDLGMHELARGRSEISGVIFVSGHEVPPGGCPLAAEGCGNHSLTQVSVVDHPAGQPRFTFTNLKGEFALALVASGKRKLVIQREGYDSAPIEVELLPQQHKVLDPVTLGSGFLARLSGSVLLENVPLPSSEYTSVTVSLRGGIASSQADADGGFFLSSPLGGTFSVIASKAGYEPAEVSLVKFVQNATTTLEQPLRLRAAKGSLRGKVLVVGSTPEDVQVCIEGQPQALCSISDPSGSFLISGVPVGPAQLTASRNTAGNHYAGRAPAPVAILADQTVDAGTITLSYVGGDFRLAGHVLSPWTSSMVVDRDVTRDTWVAIELPTNLTSGFGFFSTNLNPVWQALPLVAPTDCSLPAAQTGNSLCVQIPAVEGAQTVDLTLSTQAGGSGMTRGPLKGTIVYDVSPPAGVKVSLNHGAEYVNATGGTTLELKLEATDARSPLRAMKIITASGAPPDPSMAAAQTYNPTPAALNIPDYSIENTKHVAVRIYDAAGNWADAASSIILDKTPPTGVTITVVEANAALFVPKSQVTLELGMADSGRVRLSNDPLLAFAVAAAFIPNTGSKERRYWTLNPGEGSRTAYAIFEDRAGNASPAVSTTVTVDTVAPAQPVVQLAENPCTPSGSVDSSPNGYTRNTKLCLTTSLQTNNHFELQGCQASESLLAIFDCDLPAAVADGLKQIQLVEVDQAGNRSAATGVQVVLDRTKPATAVFTLYQGPQAAAVATKYVNSTFVFYSLGAQSDAVELEFTEGGVSRGWGPLASAGVYQLASAAQADHLVSVRVRDLAENPSDPSPVQTVRLDTLPPTTVAVNQPLPSFTNTTPLIRTLSATDPGNALWRFEISGGACLGICFPSTLGSPASHSFELNLNPSQPDLIRIHATDLAGNVGPDSVFLVTHDSVAPTAPVVFDAGTPVVNADLFGVQFSGVPSDPAFAGYQAVVTAAVSCPMSGWQDVGNTSSAQVPLIQNASNRICVRSKDWAGNFSPATELLIDEDSLAPRQPQVGPGNRVVNADAVFVWFEASDGGSEDPGNHFDHYEVFGGPFAQWSCLPDGYDAGSRSWPSASNCPPHVARDFVELPLEQDSVNELYLRGVDRAGNVGAASTAVRITEQSTVDLKAPSILLPKSPRVHGDRIVWVAQDLPSSTAVSVNLFDLSRQVPGVDGPVAITTSGLPTLISADVWKDQVVWEDTNGGSQIRTCDVDPLPCSATSVVAGSNPRIHGGRVAYTRGNEALTRLLDAGTEVSVVTFAAVASEVSVFRDAVGWFDSGEARWRPVAPLGAVVGTGGLNHRPALAGAASGPLDVWWAIASAAGSLQTLSLSATGVTTIAGPAMRGPPEIHRSARAFTVVARDFGKGGQGILIVDGIDAPPSGLQSWAQLYFPQGTAAAPTVSANRVAFVRTNPIGLTSPALLDRTWLFEPDPQGTGQQSPRVVGNRLVWIDQRDGTASGEVYLLDRSTSRRVRITAAGTDVREALVFDGRIAAWKERGATQSQVRWVDVTQVSKTGVPSTANACPNSAVTLCIPQVFNQKVIWAELVGGNADVVGVDVSASMPVAISVATGAADQRSPAIGSDGASGVRYGWIEGLQNVFWRNEASAPTCAAGGSCPGGAVLRAGLTLFGARLAWVEANRIILHTIGAGSVALTSDVDPAAVQSAPQLAGTTLVYLQRIGSRPDAVQVYDFGADLHTVALPRLSAAQSSPATDGASVVFIDEGAGSKQVMWMFKR